MLSRALLAFSSLACGATAQTLVWSQDGEALDDRFGISVSGGGDFDGDGFDDFAVSEGGSGIGTGRLLFFRGGLVLSTTPTFVLQGAAADGWFGGPVEAAGDFDGDGLDDFLVGEGMSTDVRVVHLVYVFVEGVSL